MLVPTQRQVRGKNAKSHQTHCQNGHEFNEENTYIQPKSRKRCCRACQTNRNKRKWREDLIGNREAARLHMKKWREENRTRHNKNWTELRKRKKEWIDKYKAGRVCIKCGESRTACLDFHHRNPEAKEFTISLAIARASLERIQSEVEKCDIICANCHRCLHAEEREKEVS